MENFESEVVIPAKRRYNQSRRRWIVGIILGVAIGTVLAVVLGTTKNNSSGSLFDQKSIQKQRKGIDSPYRYDCDEWNCTPLDDYVWRDNKDWSYKEVASYGSLVGPRPVKTFVMNMTSQNWLTTEEVTRTEWYHDIIISIPKNIDPEYSKSCIIYIDGGSNNPDKIVSENDVAVTGGKLIAHMTRSCVAIIRQVPNQRLYFKNDERRGEKGRTEDDIIAWTWKHFLLYPNQPDWLLRLPMTKSVRLAFDMINEKIQFEKDTLAGKQANWGEQFGDVIDEFTVTGASKRGWTTWTIASVDKRVKAIAPLVLDCLNMKKQFRKYSNILNYIAGIRNLMFISNWWQNLGGWSFALVQYYDEDLTKYVDTPEFEKMADVIDPYSYRDRLTMPKIVISATGDEFFQPDDSHLWFDDMKGKTYIRLLPNSEHGMIPPQALSSPSIIHTIRALYMSVQKKYPLPELKWSRRVDSRGHAFVTLKSDIQAIQVNAWVADTDNSTRRDWRWARIRTDKVDWPTNDITSNYITNSSYTSTDSYNDELTELMGSDSEEIRNLKKRTESLKSANPRWGEEIQFQPVLWKNVRVETVNETIWNVEVPPSYDGFRGVFIEASFPGADDRSKLTFTTELMITPDIRPFPPCSKEECIGYLL